MDPSPRMYKICDTGELCKRYLKSVETGGQLSRLRTLILKVRFYLVSRMRNKSLLSISIELFSFFFQTFLSCPCVKTNLPLSSSSVSRS